MIRATVGEIEGIIDETLQQYVGACDAQLDALMPGVPRAGLIRHGEMLRIMLAGMAQGIADRGPFEDHKAVAEATRTELLAIPPDVTAAELQHHHERFGVMSAAADRGDDAAVSDVVAALSATVDAYRADNACLAARIAELERESDTVSDLKLLKSGS